MAFVLDHYATLNLVKPSNPSKLSELRMPKDLGGWYEG